MQWQAQAQAQAQFESTCEPCCSGPELSALPGEGVADYMGDMVAEGSVPEVECSAERITIDSYADV